MAWRDSASAAHFSLAGFFFSALLRFVQLVLALAVIGLYGQYVNNARTQGKYADPNFVYAVVVGGIASLTALVFMIPFLKTARLFAWDTVVFVLWVAVFGVFARMFMFVDPHGDSAVQTMRNAVWVDLVNMLLWFISTCYGAVMFFLHRRRRSQYTGRADV